ncbi:HdeD family acid-resistance protein [Rhodococcus sp. NPDC003348]
MSSDKATTGTSLIGFGKQIWWVVLLRGVLAVLLGVMALAWPEITVWALVVVFGAYAIVDGLVLVVRAVVDRRRVSGWGWWALAGVVAIAAGVVALVWPDITALALLYVIAFYAIIFGIVGAWSSVRLRELPGSGWGWLLAASLLAVLFGVLLLIFPGSGILGIIWLLGVYAIVFGLFLIIGSFQIRSLARDLSG